MISTVELNARRLLHGPYLLFVRQVAIGDARAVSFAFARELKLSGRGVSDDMTANKKDRQGP